MNQKKIRISPDWNVNETESISSSHDVSIRISPDWNVNFDLRVKIELLSRIRISPDWNVNLVSLLSYQKSVDKFEYHQIGM